MKRPNNRNHRIIWERAHGKKLDPGYHVHHVDGNPFNNSLDNLIALTAKEHYDVHFKQGDYSACILLARSAEISLEELAFIQREHGLKCANNKSGVHSESFDRKNHLENIWKHYRPGRKPVTNGELVFKFKTDLEVENFLKENNTWRKGLPDKHKKGLSLSKKRLTSQEASKISLSRLQQGTHNFLTEYVCPYCNKKGKGPMMKRWHFENCKYA
jgi:hypothetical protein